ncbi:MAG: hypothetical protein ACD_73C00224G0001, partial [uncultured bacterium]
RYKCIPVQDAQYSLMLMCYINRNPVRAGMVQQCGDWRWSGYHFYDDGVKNDLLTQHPCYWELASSDELRRGRYRDIVTLTKSYDENKQHLDLMQNSPYLGSEEFGNKWGF